MPKLEVTRREAVYDDLRRLYFYVRDTSGPRTAAAFVDAIDERCEQIGEFPLSGKLRDDLGTGVRTMPFKSVVIVYRANADHVLITNVFHSAQDYAAILRGEREG